MNQQETYLGNPQLKAAYVPQDFTKEQIEEYIKCQTEPLHSLFAA